MSSRNRPRRTNGRRSLPPLRFGEQPGEPQDAQQADPERTDTERADQPPEGDQNGAAPAAGSRRDRRHRRSPAAPENIGQGPVRADARPAVNHQPFRHRSR